MGSILGILRKIWKEAVVAFMKALSRYLTVETIGVILGRGICPANIFFYLRIVLWLLS
jgi:hypothetical protein